MYFQERAIILVTNEQLKSIKHVHFIGIGGSGMYPIAQIFHSKGYYITGSDNNETDTLQAVRDMGIEVYLGQRAENIGDADLIIYTAAIMADNPELIAAKESGAICCERAEILGLVTSWYENALCVCGTHGKTTASSMLTQIFVDEGRDISCVIGGKLQSIHGSGLAGAGETMVCEACEFEDHFLKLYPDAAIILNVDADHLEYFKTLDNIIKSFRTFAEMASGAVIYNGDDWNTLKAVNGVEGKNMITFGFGKGNDYRAEIKSKKGLVTTFDVYYRGEFVRTLRIHVPGDHNVLNALAAVAALMYVSTYPRCTTDMGSMMGIKAFIAAVLGGIGIIPGAMLGGLIVGLIEIFVKIYIAPGWYEAITYSILIVVLLIKPSGILGKNTGVKV